MIRFSCQSCDKELHVSDTYSGKKIKCPKCKNTVLVPFVNSELTKDAPTETIKCLICDESIQFPKSNIGETIICPNCNSYFSPEDVSKGVAKPDSPSTHSIITDLAEDSMEKDDDTAGRERRLTFLSVVDFIIIVFLFVILIIVWPYLKDIFGAKKAGIGIGVILAIWIVSDFFNRKCPECGKFWGLKYTGEKKNVKVFWFLYDNEYMFRCKSCGCEVWKLQSGGF